MFKLKSSLCILAIVVLATGPAHSQSDDFYTHPQINAAGDYITNAGPVQASTQTPFTPGALWRVFSKQLNCRQDAEPNSKILLVFKQGAVLEANLGRGGSDEVIYNAKDTRGKTWMAVRFKHRSNDRCYVRANRLFIRPVQK